ncbi:MAG: transcription termination/antitermination protein NusG [Chloroflexota bacterium]
MEWYVLRTKPMMEQHVGSLLSLHEAEHFLPLVRSRRYRSRTEPLFPGYLFCRMEIPSVQWVETRSLPGIAYALGANGTPVPVPAEVVDAVRERAALEDSLCVGSRFATGQRVRIAEGPFQGLEAVFDRRLSASGRSRVFVQFLRQLVPVEIHDEQLSRNW